MITIVITITIATITILTNIIIIANRTVCFGKHTHTAEVQEFVYFLFLFRACT